MKPSEEQLMEWLYKVYGPSQGKPWHESALIHARAFAALAYEAGANTERDACVRVIEAYPVPIGNSAAGEMARDWTLDALKEVRDAIRARGEKNEPN